MFTHINIFIHIHMLLSISNPATVCGILVEDICLLFMVFMQKSVCTCERVCVSEIKCVRGCAACMSACHSSMWTIVFVELFVFACMCMCVRVYVFVCLCVVFVRACAHVCAYVCVITRNNTCTTEDSVDAALATSLSARDCALRAVFSRRISIICLLINVMCV